MSQVPPPREVIPAILQEGQASAKRLIHLIPDESAKAVLDHPLFSFLEQQTSRMASEISQVDALPTLSTGSLRT